MKKLLLQHVLIAALVVAAAPAAFAAPPDDGCARGFELWEVDDDPTYQADNRVDAEGNDDGYVCARELGRGVSTSVGVDFPVYLFNDNTLLQ